MIRQHISIYSFTFSPIDVFHRLNVNWIQEHFQSRRELNYGKIKLMLLSYGSKWDYRHGCVDESFTNEVTRWWVTLWLLISLRVIELIIEESF